MSDNGVARATYGTHGAPCAPDAAAAKQAMRAELRRRRRDRRDAAPPAVRTAEGHALLHHLAPLVEGAACVASFEPMATESNLAAVNAHVRATRRLLVPITLTDLDLSWRDAATGDDLGCHAIAQAGLVIAPALAIGPHGERLGQGGGCYDRALPRRTPGTPVIAVVFPDEVGLAVPTQAHDEGVDAVVTVNGITRFTDRLEY